MKMNIIICVAVVFILALIDSTTMAWGPGHGWRPYGDMGYVGMTIFWILAILVVAGFVCFAICLSRRNTRNKKKESLFNILSE